MKYGFPRIKVDLIDLSQSMLERAIQRVGETARHPVSAQQGDIRTLTLENERHDIVVAAATLHHLRSDDEWRHVFAKLHRSLVPGGTLWIADLIEHSTPARSWI